MRYVLFHHKQLKHPLIARDPIKVCVFIQVYAKNVLRRTCGQTWKIGKGGVNHLESKWG